MLEQIWTQVPLLTGGDRRLKALLQERVLLRDSVTAKLTLREMVKYWETGGYG
jgi:hypothetical protein